MTKKSNQGIKGERSSGKSRMNNPTSDSLIEKQLNISELKFRRLFETAQDGTLLLDAKTSVITDVNPFLLKLLGYTQDEVIGRKLWEIGPFKDIKASKESFKELQKKKYIRYENLPLQTKSRDIRYVEFVSNVYQVGEKKVIQCNIRDITDPKILADALYENEARFRELFNRMSSCVAVYEAVENGRDFIFKDFNAAAERVEKTPRQKVLGRKVTEVFPDIREMSLLTTLRRVWKTGKAQSHPVSIYKDNHIFGWRENFIYKLPSGEIVAIYEDVTEHKRNENALRLISDTQRQLVQSEDLKDVFHLVGSRIQELLGDGYVIISKLDEPLQSMRIAGLFGFGSGYESLVQMLRIDPTKMTYPLKDMSPEELRLFRSGKLEKFPGGLYHLLLRKVPKPICRVAEKRLGIGEIYTMGFIRHNTHLGGLTILAKRNITIYKPFIEIIMQQASIAINRIRSNQELRASEERFRSLYENATVGIYRTTPDGRILMANPALVRIMGYVSFEELSQRDLEKDRYGTGYSRQDFQKQIEQEGELHGVESAWKRKDSSVIYVRESAKAIREQNGKVIYYEGTVEDVSERRNAEIALQESEAHYRGLFENSPISLWEEDFSAVKRRLDELKKQGIADMHSYLESHPKEVSYCASLIRVLDVNNTTLKLFHAKNNTELLKPLSTILSPQTLQEFREELNFIAEGRTYFNWETKNQTMSGETIDVLLSWSAAPGHESDLSKVFISLIDITQRRQSEIAMQESETRYRSLFEDSPIALWEEDHSEVKNYLDKLKLNGITNFRDYFNKYPQEVKKYLSLVKVLNINKETLKIYNAKNKSEIMKDLSTVIFSDSSLTSYAEQLVQIAEGKKIIDLETMAEKLTGEKMTHLVRWQAAPGFEDSLSRVIVSVIDITERKQAEERQKILSEEEHKQRIFSEALTRNVLGLNTTLKTDEILDVIIDNIHNVIPYEAASIILIEGGYGKIVHSRGFAEKGFSTYLEQNISDFSKYLTIQKMIDSGSYVLIPDTRNDPIWIQDEQASWKILSCVEVPIKEDDKVIGFVTLNSSIPNFYNQEHAQQLMAFTDQISIAMKNARLFENTQRRMKRMNAMTLINQAINSSLDINVSLEVVLMQTMEHLGADASDILLVNYLSNTLTFAKAKGFRTNEITKSNLGLGAGLTGQAVLERKIISIPDLRSAPESYFRNLLISKEGFISYYSVPLITKGMLKGVMEIYFRKEYEADQEWLEFLEMLGQQTAIAINNAELLNSLQVSNNDLKNAYDATLQGWVEALDLRDQETEGHSLRVTKKALLLAKLMNIEDKDMINIKRGALLHDIGKISISDSILNKPVPLSEEEWKIMRKHPEYAFQLLSKTKYLKDALDIPYCHHEKWDGSGYPRGLNGEAIPKAA